MKCHRFLPLIPWKFSGFHGTMPLIPWNVSVDLRKYAVDSVESLRRFYGKSSINSTENFHKTEQNSFSPMYSLAQYD